MARTAKETSLKKVDESDEELYYNASADEWGEGTSNNESNMSLDEEDTSTDSIKDEDDDVDVTTDDDDWWDVSSQEIGEATKDLPKAKMLNDTSIKRKLLIILEIKAFQMQTTFTC